MTKLETMIAAQDAHFFAIGTANEARMESRLMDAAIEHGMAWDHDDLHGWVKAAIRALFDAQDAEYCDEVHPDDAAMYGRDENGRWEYA